MDLGFRTGYFVGDLPSLERRLDDLEEDLYFVGVLEVDPYSMDGLVVDLLILVGLLVGLPILVDRLILVEGLCNLDDLVVGLYFLEVVLEVHLVLACLLVFHQPYFGSLHFRPLI